MAETAAFEGWAILELMGHRKLAGYVREQTVAGAGFIRIDVPNPRAAPVEVVAGGEKLKGPPEFIATQLYSPGALYCLTPCAEDVARRLAAAYQPEPVTRWELPAARAEDGEEEDDHG